MMNNNGKKFLTESVMSDDTRVEATIAFSENLVDKIMPIIGKVIQEECKDLFTSGCTEEEFKQSLSNFICVINFTFSSLATAGMTSVMGGVNKWLDGALTNIYKDTGWEQDYLELIQNRMKYAVEKFNEINNEKVAH
jgi:hypothetical protein